MRLRGSVFFAVFQKIDLSSSQGAAAGALWRNKPARVIAQARNGDLRERIEAWATRVELAPDLGRDIGTRTWWRGLATCMSLCAIVIAVSPGIRAVPGAVPARLDQQHFDQYRTQMVTALALGADSGAHMGPTDAVSPLAETPERPRIELDAALGTGDSFAHTLSRSGVSNADARAAMALISQAASPESIAAGTRLRMVLGRRANRNMPRPLEKLAVRAKLELAIEINRVDGALQMTRIPIAVDSTPLRIQGKVSNGLYRSARAAGADPATIQAYLKVMASQINIGTGMRAGDRFDMIIAHRRASTGETETGELLFAGLAREKGKNLDMLRWRVGGRDQWFEASGVGQSRNTLAQPVSGARISSNYGSRKHPLLGYFRMHAGMDFAAPTGTPIRAVTDGTVNFAGWHGGHGNFVRLNHSGGLGTGYAHMSRIAVKSGQKVNRGQVIGYVGSTGLSTGPHLHYELYRNGKAINPTSVKFTEAAQLSGKALQAFKGRLTELKRLPVGPREAAAPQLAAAAQPEDAPAPSTTTGGGSKARAR
jgi:murein DD-endopeptidase MepM/ murein hydrolase activator NlpD